MAKRRRVSASPFCEYTQSQNTYHMYMQAVHLHRMLYIVCIVNINTESVSAAARVGVAVLCIDTHTVRTPTTYMQAVHTYIPTCLHRMLYIVCIVNKNTER